MLKTKNILKSKCEVSSNNFWLPAIIKNFAKLFIYFLKSKINKNVQSLHVNMISKHE